MATSLITDSEPEPIPTALPENAGLLQRMHFAATWRDYQQRALADFDAHITDQKIHLIAAPGAGKTVLGLELIRRIGRPAVIFSPTNTIRSQWQSRLSALFLDGPLEPGDFSRDLEQPGTITAVTYQGLHTLAAGDSTRLNEVVDYLQRESPVTLVLDEAHHLRREWWRVLRTVVDALPTAKIVSLTATPPYDAPLAEWSRYAEMCGPVDLEISVPELVRNGDLCPHQDHVVLSAPGPEPLELLNRRQAGLSALLAELRTDVEFLGALEHHPWLTACNDHVEEILDGPEQLSAMLVQLAASGRVLPKAPLHLLGVRRGEVPLPSAFWTEVLLNALFGKPDFVPMGDEWKRRLRTRLHEFGMIEGGVVRLGASRASFKLMAESLSKLDSVISIVGEEWSNLGPELRMVILADHVRGGDLPKVGAMGYVPAKLGVVPIFGSLRKAANEGCAVGVLTGNLIILPTQAAQSLQALCTSWGLDPRECAYEPLAGCDNHVRVVLTGGVAQNSVELVTAIFAFGAVNVLIGTQALLGEGWDAPCVNSLVLASNSAAFMLSNQMRGRAIRIDPRRPDKVSNIWHLATLTGSNDGFAMSIIEGVNWGYLGGDLPITSDLDLVSRRFLAFECISNDGASRVESGIDRLGLDPACGTGPTNRRTYDWARNRSRIAQRWRYSLGEAPVRAQVREVATSDYAPRSLAWRDTLRWLSVSAATSAAFAASTEAYRLDDLHHLGTAGMAIAGSVALVISPKLLKASWLWFRNGSAENSVREVGAAVLTGLQAAGVIDDWESAQASVTASTTLSGSVDITVMGLPRAKERAFITAIMEVLGPVQNPRYLLCRRSLLGLFTRNDFHAIPTVIGARKDSAEAFHRAWQKHVGSSELIFTRNAEGRRILLQARARSFAAGFQRRINRRSAWL